MLAFYYGSGSPFAWRVWLALEHKGLPYEQRVISFDKRETQSPEYTKLNPRAKVPVIVDGDFTLYESAAILEYLDERFPDTPRLFPADLRERAIVRRVVRETDHYVGVPVQAIARELFTRAPEQREALDRHIDLVRREVAGYEQAIAGEYLCGALSAADFSLYPLFAMLARFEKRKPDLRWEIGPRVTSWMQRIEALPYFRKTYPPHWT